MSCKFILINTLPTSSLFGAKVDPGWFEKAGIETVFLDASKIHWKEDNLQNYFGGNTDYKFEAPNHLMMENKEVFMKNLESIDDRDVVFLLSRGLYSGYKDKEVLERLAASRANVIYQHFRNPFFSKRVGLAYQVMKATTKTLFSKRLPDGLVGSGKLARRLTRIVMGERCQFISIRSLDILWSGDIEKLNYNVFVDEAIIMDPDAGLLGKKFNVDIRGYYERLENMFAKVEYITGNPIVIACSIKYKYLDGFFGDRLVIYGDTLRTIKKCSLVIGHLSGALEQAIVDCKPMVHLIDESFTQYKINGVIESAAKSGRKAIFMKNITESDIINAHEIDHVRCKRYVDNYLREPKYSGDYNESFFQYIRRVSNE